MAKYKKRVREKFTDTGNIDSMTMELSADLRLIENRIKNKLKKLKK